MSFGRSGYVLSGRGWIVVETLSRQRCNSAVACVLSGGDDAAVDERSRLDRIDILPLLPSSLVISAFPVLLHEAESAFHAHRSRRQPESLAIIEIRSRIRNAVKVVTAMGASRFERVEMTVGYARPKLKFCSRLRWWFEYIFGWRWMRL